MQHLGKQRVYHGVASIALITGLLGGGGGGLLGILGGNSSPAASTATQPGGHLSAPNQKLRKGCRTYSYSYSITVPQGDDFDLETFVTDKRGVSQASDVILSGADPLSGVKHMTICRSNTVRGTFTLHGTLYTNDGSGPTTTTPLPDATFKLTYHKHRRRHH